MALTGGLARVRWALAALVAGLTGLWLVSAPFDPALAGLQAGADAGLEARVFALRPGWLQGTGSLALGLMSVAMLLATRPVRVEPALDGLDKMYRLHRWLGIGALGLSVAHWLWVEAPKWAVDAGWLMRPPRQPAVPSDHAWMRPVQALRGAAEQAGEWAFYALLLLLALALLPRLPYRRFFQSHRLLPLVYLALVFHAVVLTRDQSWTEPVGLVMAVLMAAGSLAAMWVLLGAVGRSRQALAQVVTAELIGDPGSAPVLALGLRLQGRWAGHAAGQFGFLRWAGGSGPHPFTITSPWLGDGHLAFLIKGLGVDTCALPGLLKVGDLVRVEGPYGCFDFQGRPAHQIWVGGGIGITPFIARLQQLALQPDGKVVDLFYTSQQTDEALWAQLRQAAQAAGVRLHCWLAADHPPGARLDARQVCAAVPGWQSADVWFCGPAGFGQQLRHDLLARGLPGGHFHQELFSLR